MIHSFFADSAGEAFFMAVFFESVLQEKKQAIRQRERSVLFMDGFLKLEFTNS